jgi:putative transposase
MTSLYETFLLILASAGDCAVAHQVAYLKVENVILRTKLPRWITVTAEERSCLLRFGKAVRSALKDLIGIVTPRTFARRAQNESSPKQASAAPTGRPRTGEEIQELILRLARDTSWGYKRILGELKKLGVKVSKSTIVNVLKEAGIETGPQRGQGTWAAFATTCPCP